MVWLHIALAGLTPVIFQWGLGIGLIILFLALAWFSPIFKVDFLWAAALIAVFLFAMGYGAKLENGRHEAQSQAVQAEVTKTVAQTQTAKAKASKDPWDNPRN